MRAQKLITVFVDLGIENELKLRDWFNKQFVPELRIKKGVKDVRFEFITEGLLYGKVLGKKAYKVRVPTLLYNSVLNSSVVTDRVVVNGKEYRVEWPEFYFANPDKMTVKIRELRRRQRREGWKGKAFKSVFWDWDGAVTLRAVIEFEDGSVGYYDLLRVVFVYKGNASRDLKEGATSIARMRKEKRMIKRYLLDVYRDVAGTMKALLDAVDTGRREDLPVLLSSLAERLKESVGERWRSAYRYILTMVSRYMQLSFDQAVHAMLTNRAAGAKFLVIAEYRRVYNPVDGKNVPLKFYALARALHVERTERWEDEFGSQKFMVVNDTDMGEVISRVYGTYDIEVDSVIAENVEVRKRFTPAGLRGFLNHELRISGVPPKNIVVDNVEQADIKYLKRSIRLPQPTVLVTVLTGTRTAIRKPSDEECWRKCGYNIYCWLLRCDEREVEEKYIVYVLRPTERAARIVIYSKDHRGEGKDRILVHLDTGRVLVFIHRL